MMHRAGAVFVAMVLLLASAWGQEAAVSAMDRFDQELQRIGSVRDQKTAELDAQDAACLNQFAVTDCQNKVAARRRQILADLKRQESTVKDAQRRQKAADQIQRSADKAAEKAQREAELQASEKGESESVRQKAQDEKVQSHRQQAKPAEPKASGPKVASGLDAEAQAKNRAVYQEKMQATEKRRQERDQRVRDHGTGGPPLPATP